MKNPVIIFGFNGVAKAAMEIFNSHNIEVYGFLSDDKDSHGKEVGEVTVLGNPKDDGFLKLIGKKCEAFVATDSNEERKEQVKMLNERRKVMPTNAVHAEATISKTAHIGHGNFINAGAFLGAEAEVKSHCLIHSRAVLDHGVIVEDYVQVGAGSILNSEVEVGEGTFIGSGVTVISGVKIGKNARVGAGSVVISNVEDGETVFGNPAVAVKK